MKEMEALLKRWHATSPKRISMDRIECDPALQPRAPELVQARHQPRQEAASAEHVANMRARLEASAETEMEPLLVAHMDGRLLLVDGHHRLIAYRRAQRREAPARILDMDRRTAVALSKLVNLDGVKLAMDAEQRRDALWQHMAHITARGVHPLGESLRSIASRFGVSHGTAGNMHKRLPTIRLDDFTPDALDPGTGWPRWKHCKGCGGWKDAEALLGMDALRQRNAEKVATRLWKMLDQCGPEAFLDGLRLAAAQASERDDEETKAALVNLADAEEGEDSFDF